jgi:oligoendopeptidase F
MTASQHALPHWDVSSVYPSLESAEFEAGLQAAIGSIDKLAALFDEHHIGRQDPIHIDEAVASRFETVTSQYNAVLDETNTLSAYISSFVSTNSRNALAQAKRSEFQQHLMKLSLLDTRFVAWIGSIDVEELIQRSALARDHAFMLRKAKQEASHLMSPAEEALAAELNLTGGMAWAKLHGDFTSQLTVGVEPDGEARKIPMSAVRNLAYNPDRGLRRRAYEAEVAAWQATEVPLAAAMNSIKGQVNALAKRRGWDSALDAALFQNNIDRQTLDAMMLAAHESFPHFRRYLKAKARILGLPSLAWFDMFAPVGQGGRTWPFDKAAAFIVEQFGTFSPKMSGLAQRAFSERWIDAEPREGKVDGAFCMRLRADESRVLANYEPCYGKLSTLAHELGHAYHNLNLASRTMLQRQTPMILAETASIFCETIVRHAAMHKADAAEQLSILESSLQNACQVVVDISSRFLFEQEVFSRRPVRELSPAEFKELLLEAQTQTYGDGLDPETYHPYMWALKGHYYSTGRSFYNYPYMFGLLFGLGLYARYVDDAQAFRASYDDLLSSTGMYNAADLAARFGIDIRTPDFWRASLGVVRADIDRFEALADRS